MAIKRRLPNSTPTRLAALRKAHSKLHSNPPGGPFLTPKTIMRLDALLPLYSAAALLINAEKARSVGYTKIKNEAQDDCRMYVSHFLQNIIMATERKLFAPEVLAYYDISVSHPVLHPLTTEQEVITAAEDAINGETARITAGGTPMTMPSMAEVQQRLDDFKAALSQQSSQADALDIAQEARDKLNPEANRVIKKIWDEIETHYNEESRESMRANAREWGIVYVSDTRIKISGRVVTVAGNSTLPIAEATITIAETEDTTTTNAEGYFKLKTGIVGTATIMVSAPGYLPATLQHSIISRHHLDIKNVVLEPG
jgi:hypothetical protein